MGPVALPTSENQGAMLPGLSRRRRRVLALDLSISATGIAHPGGELSTFRPTVKGDGRLLEITDEIHLALLTYQPHLVVVEGPVLRSQAAISLAMLHGAVRHTLLNRSIPYLVVPPATLKTYATGRGNAQKPDMRMELYKRTGADVADDNQVDAAWLRLLAFDLLGHPELELPKTHRRALDKLTLPLGIPA